MNNPIPLEDLTRFSQTSQAMMQQLATGLLTSGDSASNFTRYSELASVQQNFLQQMGGLWVNSALGSGSRAAQPKPAPRWRRRSVHVCPRGSGCHAVFARGWAESHAHDDTELCDACERSSDWSVGGP